VRVAALADVHGNPAALEAVLRDVGAAEVDRIVFCGDLVSGPFPEETLRLLRTVEGASFVRGNGDREAVEAYDAGNAYEADAGVTPANISAWVASRLTRDDRDFLAAFEDTVALDVDGLGAILFCHGSPRSDLEIITHVTPPERLAEFLSDTEQNVVVCGHTHMQFEREQDGTRVLNTGSVGMPYQGERGAFWLLLGPDAEFRRSDYDVDAFTEQVATSGYVDDELTALLLRPPGADETAAFFEGTGPEPELK
jgi:predicted phosphodiesterase